MATTRMERLAPLAGVVFTVLFAVGFLTSADTPDSKASGEDVVKFYKDGGKFLFAFLILTIAAVLFMFFAGFLRRHLTLSGPDWLASVAFGGAVIYVGGLGIFAFTQFALVQASDNNQVAVAQTLNVIDDSNFAPALIGAAVILLASAWHVLAARSLPIWLGWVALILGILAFAGPLGFISFLLFPFWVLAVAIVLFRRADVPRVPATVET